MLFLSVAASVGSLIQPQFYIDVYKRQDIDRAVDHISAASCFTWMLTDQCTCGREWIILADEFYCILIPSHSYQCYITRNIYLRRTERDTWYRLFKRCRTPFIMDMCCLLYTSFCSNLLRYTSSHRYCGYTGRTNQWINLTFCNPA